MNGSEVPSPTVSPDAEVMELVVAKIKTHAVGVFAQLGLADLLADGPQSARKLAERTGTHAPSLNRLLRTLAALNVVSEPGPGVYGLTSVGQLLRSDVSGSMRGIATMFGSEFHARAWGCLTHSVSTGEPAFDRVFKMPIFEYLEKNPELAAAFDEAMTSSSAAQSRAVAEAYDFSGIGTLVDVGGGHGTLLATILKDNPALRGVLLELPHVADGAGRVFREAGVHDRVQVMSGDFLENVPAGGDAYVMKRILHDWDDERAAKLLGNCRAAMAPDGRVLVVDAVIDDSPGSLYGKLLDMEMLVLTPYGKERTEEEFRRLFEVVGLRLERVVEMASPLKVVEARRA
jgi:hypothetical protein